MTIQALSGFRALKTHHCITGSMRHIYEFHQHPISEDMLLGLGAGVGFVYWHMKGTLPFMGGRANVGRPCEEGLEKTAGKRSGVRVEFFETSSHRKAQKALMELLTQGEPVMVMVDMGFLPYFDFPEEYHFGGHAVVIAGYDLEHDEVLVADRDGRLHPVGLDALSQARGSTYKPFPPRNQWFTFDFNDKRTPHPEEVQRAIYEVSSGMLNPPIANLGVKGIHTAAERILAWPDVMTEKELQSTCANARLFIDADGGTGGGLFRYMYGRFLKEAAAIVGDSRLETYGDNLRKIGDRWQQVAQVLTQASAVTNPDAELREASSLIQTIANLEQEAWEKLHSVVGEQVSG